MKKRKPYTKMTLQELRAATRQFDKEIPFEQTRPLSPEKERQFRASQRASLAHRRRRNRKTIVVAVDTKLLIKSDQYAAQHGLSRSDLIEQGLRSALAAP